MDINPAYNCLLGRPRIHVVWEMTFTLHQKRKFMFKDKLVIIYGEEDLLVSELLSFWYMETEEGIAEILPSLFEIFEDVSYATSNQDKVSKLFMSSVKSAKETLERGIPPGWG